eukprot:TRINITY_DN9532_c0_g2_i1.p1 TRINITY_DN9532_c0_g2~~TRINITY_DN9532_c0_g2_i1.p1  ORF type:complete len:260 (+),score=63.45 TRINITY_DN9532_c0_g2_i1:325-1104(+)
MHSSTKIQDLSDYDQANYKQILADVPRTMPEYPIFALSPIQAMLTRILFIWNMRHPGSGYVQGINDLCLPFLVTYLGDYFRVSLADADSFLKGLDEMGKEKLELIEADVYWCLCKVVDNSQDVYTAYQVGAQKMLARIKEIVKRVNEDLYNHIANQDIDFMQFGFRWINCFLLREFPLDRIIRMWDTYFSEEESFAEFHVYVCASFLLHWEKEIMGKEFPGLLSFLQSLPTQDWKEDDIGILMANAYQYKMMFHKTKHL